jgi:hypothetical protein
VAKVNPIIGWTEAQYVAWVSTTFGAEGPAVLIESPCSGERDVLGDPEHVSSRNAGRTNSLFRAGRAPP